MKLNTKNKKAIMLALMNDSNIQSRLSLAFCNFKDFNKPTCVGGVICRAMLSNNIEISSKSIQLFTGLTDLQCSLFASITLKLNSEFNFKQIAMIIDAVY